MRKEEIIIQEGRNPLKSLWKHLQSLKSTVSFMQTGAHPDDEGMIRYEIGTYGAYLTYNQKTFNIAHQHDFRTFSLEEAIEIIDN